MPLSTVKFEEIEAQVRALAGASDYSNPNSATVRRWGNVILHKIAKLLSGIDKPWGRTSLALTLSLEQGVVFAPGSGVTFTLASRTFNAVLDFTYVGGWAFFVDGLNNRAHFGLIDRVGAADCELRFTIGTGALVNISSANLHVFFKPNPAFYNGASIHRVPILDFVKLVDSTNGNVRRLNADVFASAVTDYHNRDSVFCQHAGDAVYIEKGTNISSLGTLTLTYDELPEDIEDGNSNLDLLPDHHQMFVEELARWVLNYLNVPVPERLQNPLGVLEAQYKKNLEVFQQRLHKQAPAERTR